MDNLITQETIASLLQAGGQYLLPAAALLRALYFGVRGKLPEGFLQIIAASTFAGVTAVVDQQQPDLRSLVLGVLGNTAFTAGLLAFIVAYLLRFPFMGLIVDAIVGGFIGIAAWIAWVYLLGNPLEWWTLAPGAIGGAFIFMILRLLLRQIGRLVRLATWLIVLGLLFVLGAGGVLVLTSLAQGSGLTLNLPR